MSTVQEIEHAIHQLSPDERWDLLHRFEDELWTGWDRQIEEDLNAGSLEALISEARSEMAAGKTRPLNEVIDNR